MKLTRLSAHAFIFYMYINLPYTITSDNAICNGLLELLTDSYRSLDAQMETVMGNTYHKRNIEKMKARSIIRFVFIEGMKLSLIMTVVILSTVFWNPYLWLNDYPPDIRTFVGEVDVPRVQIIVSGLAIILANLVMLTRSYKKLADETHSKISFSNAFATLFLIGFVFSLFDLVILDWLIFCTIQPDFFILPGTDGMAGYKDYAFHAREAFLSTTPYLGNAILATISILIGQRL